MATKYITYTYPLLSPASLLLGSMVAKQEAGCFTRKYFVFVGVGFTVLLAGAFWATNRGLIADTYLFILPLAVILAGVLGGLMSAFAQAKIYTIACTAMVFYLGLIFSIAVPFSQVRSAKALGIALAEQRVKEVGLYGSYPTSAVFYSGSKLVKLVPEEELESYKPKSMSWSSKNVMPFAAMEQQHYPLVIVSSKSIKDFMKHNHSQWVTAGRRGQYLLLQSVAGKMDNSSPKGYNNAARLSAKSDWRNNHGRT